MRGVIPALANTVGGMGFPVQGKDFQQGVVIGMINGQAPGTFADLETPSRTAVAWDIQAPVHPRTAAAPSPAPAARRHRGDHDGALTPSSALCCEG
jgi:hypothetical protein